MAKVRKELRREGPIFCKQQDPALAAEEVRKTRLGCAIAATSKLFKVPAIRAYNDALGRIEFEWLDNLVPLSVALCVPEISQTLAATAGRSLRQIHDCMKIAEQDRVGLPAAIAIGSGAHRALHGDFNLVNVCVERDTLTLVVLDWSMSPIFGGASNYGNYCYDLTWFIYNVFSDSSLRFPRIENPRAVADTFVAAYEEAGDCAAFSREELREYMRCFAIKWAVMRRQELGPLVHRMEWLRFHRLNRWIEERL